MNIKICSQCDQRFDIDQAKYRDYFSSPLCNDCYDKGLKPSGWPEHWEWTHSWPRKFDENNSCFFCKDKIPDGHFYCNPCRIKVNKLSMYAIVGDILTESDIIQLKRFC